jgi:hypothetical protein
MAVNEMDHMFSELVDCVKVVIAYKGEGQLEALETSEMQDVLEKLGDIWENYLESLIEQMAVKQASPEMVMGALVKEELSLEQLEKVRERIKGLREKVEEALGSPGDDLKEDPVH